MTFGEAIEKAKAGYRIKRDGWNGKNQYVVLGEAFSYCREGAIFNPMHDNIGSKAFIFHGTSGEQVGWLASQADMLADDWELE